MEKVLLILCGSSNSNLPKFKKRYRLVIDEATRRGYSNSELITWPGQSTGEHDTMNLKTASEHLMPIINKLEVQNSVYDITAFSWGVNVILYTLNKVRKVKGLDRLVLWGLDEYWRLYDYFSDDEKTKQTIKKLEGSGTKINADFFSYEVPNEILLRDYPHTNKVKICFGEKDLGSPPTFGEYLKSFVHRSNIIFEVVSGMEHVVTEYNEQYLKCLFD